MDMIPYYYKRVVHGVLMTLSFVGFHYLGAFFGARLAQTKGEARKTGAADLQLLFWAHAVLQGAGLVLGTAGFAYSLATFEMPYGVVARKHGTLGVAVMALAYFQGLLGVLRPKPLTDSDLCEKDDRRRVHLRRSFEFLHSILGKVTLALGLINCFTGIALMEAIGFLDSEGLDKWVGITAGWLILVYVADGVLDKREACSRESERANGGRQELAAI